MNLKTTKKAIVFDADVLIHFSKGASILILKKIYPQYEKWVLEAVKGELKYGKAKNELDLAFMDGFIKLIDFPPISSEIYREYAKIKRDEPSIGEGEAHCLAFVRFNDNVLASANLRDIRKYCETHNIVYLTTMDLLCEAVRSEIMTEEEADKFIDNVKSQNSKLPCSYLFEYLDRRYL